MFNNTSASKLFLIKCLIIYLLWYVVYDLCLHQTRILDDAVIHNLALCSSFFLKSIGYTLIDFSSYDTGIVTLGIDGSHGVWIGDNCNGIALFALFTGFIIAFPGKIWHKLIYIISGITLIHLLNVLRISALCLISLYAPQALDFNHTYTFTIIVYAFIFFLWYLWVKKFQS